MLKTITFSLFSPAPIIHLPVPPRPFFCYCVLFNVLTSLGVVNGLDRLVKETIIFRSSEVKWREDIFGLGVFCD